MAAALSVLYAVVDTLQLPSRRACNLTYVLWVLALNMLLLLVMAVADVLCRAWEPTKAAVRTPHPAPH